MSSRKLEYLSKYSSSLAPKGNNDHKTTKDKKKKTSKKKTKNVVNIKTHDDDDWMQVTAEGGDGSDGDYDDDGGGPILVPDVEEDIAGAAAGSWINDEATSRGGRRHRYDSDDDNGDDVEQFQLKKRRKRYDSDDSEVESFKKLRSNSDNNSNRKKSSRQDSNLDDDIIVGRNKFSGHDFDQKIPNNSTTKRKRFDSDDITMKDSAKGKLRTNSNNNDDVGDRKTFKTDEANDISKPRSNSDENDTAEQIKKLNRARGYDRDGDGAIFKDVAAKFKQELMSSGHSAGLQHASKFREAEHEIQTQKRLELENMPSNFPSETVYRDKDGKKMDVEAEFQKNHRQSKERKELTQEEQFHLRMGKVQKEQLEAQYKERESMQHSEFARKNDDEGLDAMRKSAIRAGDPMAIQAHRKQQQQQQKVPSTTVNGGVPAKPVYKGPQPKPNRYGIRPGYRWDGVDRGNGFEDKVLAAQFSRQRKKEIAYKWSSADM